jgi:hypothetical protein
MTKKRFNEIKRYLHVCGNTQVDMSDKLFKKRKFLTIILQNIQLFGVFSVDESMLPYYGKFGIKRFIKGFKI